MTLLQVILLAALALAAISLLGILAWLAHSAWLTFRERRLARRKGLYRRMVTELSQRERTLLEPAIHRLETIRDVEALEALLEEQARVRTDRPAWLLDTYDRLGLVRKYVQRLRESRRWRDRAFAAELLGRVGNATAVPALLETVRATRTEDADVREIALRALARIGDPRAVRPLVLALRESEPWLAPRIADILVRHRDEAVEPMLGFLEEPGRHPARAWAANILGELQVARAFPTLSRALEDPDDEVRAKAATALGKIGDRRAVSYLLERLLADPAPFVRARTAAALGLFEAPEVVDRLVRGLGDPAWWVRMRSVEALERIGGPAEGALLLALEDTEPEIRLRAAVALERLGVPARLVGMLERGEDRPEVIETLTRFGHAGARELMNDQLRHPAARVRLATVQAIRHSGRRDLALPLVESLRADRDPGVRTAALEALRVLGVRQAVPAAMERLADEDAGVRAAAADLLGTLGGPEAMADVRGHAGDDQPGVRAAVARALSHADGSEAHSALLDLLRDPDAEVRLAAAGSLGGGTHRGAVPELVERLTDADPRVRAASATALGGLGDTSVAPQLARGAAQEGPEVAAAYAAAAARLDPPGAPALLAELTGREQVPARVALLQALHAHAVASMAAAAAAGSDPDPAVRAEAASLAGRSTGAASAALLVRLLADEDPMVRARAVDGLARVGTAGEAPAVLEVLASDPDAGVRERAALAIGLSRPPGGEVALLEASRTAEGPEVRAAAALALGAYDQVSIVAELAARGDEAELRRYLDSALRTDAEYRLLAQRVRASQHLELRALAAGSRADMAATLADGLRGTLAPGDRLRVVAGLRALGGSESRGALGQLVRGDPDPRVRRAALEALGAMTELPDRERLVRDGLADPDAGVRSGAIRLSEDLEPSRALPALLAAPRQDEAVDDAAARRASEAPAVVSDLVAAEDATAASLVRALGLAARGWHASWQPLLGRAAAHPAPEVRAALARALGSRPELAGGSMLDGLLADPVPAVRLAAVAAAVAARRADLLRGRLADPDDRVREAAQAALGGSA